MGESVTVEEAVSVWCCSSEGQRLVGDVAEVDV